MIMWLGIMNLNRAISAQKTGQVGSHKNIKISTPTVVLGSAPQSNVGDYLKYDTAES